MEGDDSIMGVYVYHEESPLNKGKHIIRLNPEKFPFDGSIKGSYNVFLARIAGLDYADFLRMCRDVFGAELAGKGTMYPVPYFDFNEGLFALTQLLDQRARLLTYRYRHPYEFIKTKTNMVKKYDDGHVEVADESFLRDVKKV